MLSSEAEGVSSESIFHMKLNKQRGLFLVKATKFLPFTQENDILRKGGLKNKFEYVIIRINTNLIYSI